MSFLKAWDKVRQFREDTDDAALSAIETGNNVADDFWNNFITVCNNKEGVASLLGVTTSKVATWQQTIKDKMDQAGQSAETKVNHKIINTGTPSDEESNEELS